MNCRECGREMKKADEDYLFTSSGLDYVYLRGMDHWRCGCGEETVRIPRMKELLEKIGEIIVTKKPRLEAQDILYLRKGMGLKAKEMSEILGVDPTVYSRWENGKKSPGTANERLIRLAYAASKKLDSIEDLAHFFPETQQDSVRQILRTVFTGDKVEFEFEAAA